MKSIQTKKLKLKKPFLIAEIGINHNGSIKLAKKMIDLAKSIGFDADLNFKKEIQIYQLLKSKKMFFEILLGGNELSKL